MLNHHVLGNLRSVVASESMSRNSGIELGFNSLTVGRAKIVIARMRVPLQIRDKEKKAKERHGESDVINSPNLKRDEIMGVQGPATAHILLQPVACGRVIWA